MGVTPGYKRTEVGVIPEEWEMKLLGDVATIRDGTHQTPKYVATGVPFFSVEHVTSGDFKNTKFISEKEHRFLTRSFKIEKGDILMTRIGSIGDCKLIDWDVDASFYVSLALLKIKSGYSAAFIAHYSKSAAFQKEVELHSLQSAIPKKINLGPISNVRIVIPTPPEQRAIAAALSDMDALLGAQDRLIAKKRDLKQAAMQQLLTGQTRLPGFQGEWEVKLLGEVATIKDGTHQTPKYVASGVPFYSVEQVTSGDFKNTKFISEEEHRFLTRSFKIEKGDILMTRIGSIGDCKLIDWDVEASFYVSLALLKINSGYSAAYIAHYSRSAAFQKEVELHSLQSAIPKKINLGPISGVKIELPPLPEQTAIAEVLNEMDAELAGLEQRREKTRALKQGMMQELLTGRTRLVAPSGTSA